MKKKSISENKKIAATDGILIVNRKMKINEIDQVALRISGLNIKDYNGKLIETFLTNPKEDLFYFEETFSSGRAFYNLSLNIKCSKQLSENESMNVISSIIPINKPGKLPKKLIFVFRNTKSHIALSQLVNKVTKEKNNFSQNLKFLTDNCFESILSIDQEGKILSNNSNVLKLFKRTSEEIIGKSIFDFISEIPVEEDINIEYGIEKKQDFLSFLKCDESVKKENLEMIDEYTSEKNENKDDSKEEKESTEEKVNLKTLIFTGEININNNQESDSSGVLTAGYILSETGEVKNILCIISPKIEQAKDVVAETLPTLPESAYIIEDNPAMEKVYAEIDNISEFNENVFINGPKGTGKLHVARILHERSENSSSEFEEFTYDLLAEEYEMQSGNIIQKKLFGFVNDDAIFVPGRIHTINNGTIYFKSIEDFPMEIQEQLYETISKPAIEDEEELVEPVKCRVVLSSSIPFDELEDKIFPGLYTMFQDNIIYVPTLKERITDIVKFIKHFLNIFNEEYDKEIKSVTPELLSQMINYSWPGNFNELETKLKEAYFNCNDLIISKVDMFLPDVQVNEQVNEQTEIAPISGNDAFIDKILSYEDPLKNVEKIALEAILEKFEGHRQKTAEVLGMNKSTLWRKMKKYDLIT